MHVNVRTVWIAKALSSSWEYRYRVIRAYMWVGGAELPAQMRVRMHCAVGNPLPCSDSLWGTDDRVTGSWSMRRDFTSAKGPSGHCQAEVCSNYICGNTVDNSMDFHLYWYTGFFAPSTWSMWSTTPPTQVPAHKDACQVVWLLLATYLMHE